MRITNLRALPGPNIYLYRTVLRAEIDLEEGTGKESTDFPGFGERLLTAVPELRRHLVGEGGPTPFADCLEEGIDLATVVEHVALELHHRADLDISFSRTVPARTPGQLDILIEYHNEAVGRYLLQVAVELVAALVRDVSYPLAEKLDEARKILAETELGPSTRAIVEAAERRGIPWVRLNEGSLVQLGQGARRKVIQATESPSTSSVAVDIACDKALTKKLFSDALIPVPHGTVVRSRDEALAAFARLRPPLAVKPLDGNQGRGVSLGLHSAEEVGQAYDAAAAISSTVVVEEFFTGRDYRVVVVNGRVVAASERTPAHVVGDGVHTISELVKIENRNPMRGEGHEKPLTQLRLDPETDRCLHKQGKGPGDVPAAGERVLLRETANLSTGGTARDVSDDIHPDIACLCERAARIIGLDICGIDLIAPDISRPLPAQGAGIIEVNAAPGIRMHHYPSAGKPRDVGAAIVDMLYPPGTEARIPIVAITGTNGKTTVTRMIGHALHVAGRVVGMTTSEGISVAGQTVARGDLTGYQSARTVLSDSLVEVAVLETARGGIVRRSLGYDWADVGVLTNIQPDHLGQDGVNDLEDLLFVKSLVAERVREDGTLVLNAEDERLAQLPDHPRVRKIPRRVVYFSLSVGNPVVQAHLAAGGTAFYLKDGWLLEATGRAEHRIVRAAAVPATYGGTARFQIANALAACAACRALGLSGEEIAHALGSFGVTAPNSGRMNLYQVKRGYVMVDFGHNLGAFAAFGEMMAAWPDRRVTAILTVPGDRPNELIEQVGRLVARCFDRIFLREDEDPRGRPRGEVTGLLRRVIAEEAPEKECRIMPTDVAALRAALEDMVEEEVIAFFFEDYPDAGLEVLRSFGARPVTGIELRAVSVSA